MSAPTPADPSPDDREPPPTLGQRLAATALAALDRRRAVVSWLDRAMPMLDRAGALADARAGRFERIEVAPDRWASGDRFPAASAPPVARPCAPFGDAADRVVGLPAALRERLGPLLATGPTGAEPTGAGLAAVRIHQGAQADALTREYGAAAVTVGQEIYFRTGRFRPDTADGRALLAHELTHVAVGRRAGSSWLRASAAGVAEEEQAAEAAAAAARAVRTGPAAGDFRNGSPAVWPGAGFPTGLAPLAAVPDRPVHPSGHAAPHAARPEPQGVATMWPATLPSAVAPAPARPVSSRPMAAPDRPAGTAATAAAAAGPDLQALRESVRRDLLRGLRTDAERGG